MQRLFLGVSIQYHPYSRKRIPGFYSSEGLESLESLEPQAYSEHTLHQVTVERGGLKFGVVEGIEI